MDNDPEKMLYLHNGIVGNDRASIVPMAKAGGQTRDEREMVNGIADILAQVRDRKNRAEIARNMVGDFKREDVQYDYEKFMRMSKLQQGGQLPSAQLGWEYKVDNWLGRPMERAERVADKYTRPGEDQTDNLRHPLAGRYTSEAIQRKTGNIPVISNMLGFIGASAAGLGHELLEPNRGPETRPYTLGQTIREGAEDQFNNMVGALIGSLPFMSAKRKTETLKYLSDNNLIPDGYGRNSDNMYFKKNGGQHGGLDRWFAEKWVDVKTGKQCGRQEGEKRGYPACRPSKRVSSQTPKTSSEMSSAEKAKFTRTKTSSERIPYNHQRKQFGGMTTADSVRHQAHKILQYEQLRGGPGGTPLPYYSDPKYMKMLMDTIYPQVKNILPNASAMEAGEAMDFIFNAGWDKDNKKILRDPRAYALQEYYKQYDPSKLDKDGKWPGRKNPAYSFDQEYNSTIGKLPENQRRVMMNRGRDWYYKNINNPAPGVPNDDYYNTWYGRIWNTNDFQPFNPYNLNFTPKKK